MAVILNRKKLYQSEIVVVIMVSGSEIRYFEKDNYQSGNTFGTVLYRHDILDFLRSITYLIKRC